MASKTESAQRPGARTDARTKGVGAEGTAAWKATLQGNDWSRLIIGALNTRYWRTCISIAAFQMGGKQKHKAEAQDRVRDLKVRRFTEVRANRENPGVHHTSGRAGPRGHPVRERWLSVWPANAPYPEGTPVAAPIGVLRSSTSMSRTPQDSRRQKKKKSPSFARIGRLKPAPPRLPRRMQYPLCYNPA